MLQLLCYYKRFNANAMSKASVKLTIVANINAQLLLILIYKTMEIFHVVKSEMALCILTDTMN